MASRAIRCDWCARTHYTLVQIPREGLTLCRACADDRALADSSAALLDFAHALDVARSLDDSRPRPLIEVGPNE